MEQHRNDYLQLLRQGPPFITTKRNYSQDDFDLLHVKGVYGLRRDIRRIITDRLARHGVSTEGIPALMLEHCLPKDDAYARHWNVLIHTPLKVFDQMLLDMLGLRTANERTQPDKGSRQTFVYIRSFQMTVVQLIETITDFHGTGLQYAKTTAWLRSIEMMRPQELVFVRYVGRTTREPIRRHREDLLIRKTGFLAEFLASLEKNYPMVIDSAMVYVFPVRQLVGLRGASKYNEIREQAAIALLGLPYLLNQAMTDFVNWQFDPSPAYRQAFVDLGIDTISRMGPSRFHRTPASRSLIAWEDEIQRYAREHKEVVSVWRNRCHEFPDLLKHMMVKQATPSLFEGKYVLMLTVGAGISHGSYRTAEAFYTGYSSSAILMKSSLTRLRQWEQSKNCVEYGLSDLIDAGAFPFVDLCPWHKAEGSNLQAAADFLKQYIGLAKPLIILTFSAKPSSLIASGFATSEGSASDFWTRVGNLELVHPTEGLCCIQIPCFHPGQGRFSINPTVFLKVFDMTLWVLLLAINVTLDSMAMFNATNRHGWCAFIKANVESILNDQGFCTKFNNLKASLYSERPTSRMTCPISTERSVAAVATRKDIDRYIYSGYAVDGSMSTRQRQQVYRLWIMNIPELHVHINRNRAQNWFTWANQLEEGTSFFVLAMAQAIWQVCAAECFPTILGPHVAILQLLKGLSLGDRLHENLTHVITSPQEWASSEDVLETLTLELSSDQWLWQQIHDEPFRGSSSVAELSRYKPLYQVRLNGIEVFLWKNRSLALHWASPSGVNYKFVLRAPQSSQNETYARRKYLFFTKDGIDLRDSNGDSCLVHGGALGSENVVTFPVHRLPSCQDTQILGEQLVRLWELETGHDWKQITSPQPITVLTSLADDEKDCLPESYFTGEGLELIRWNWTGTKLAPYKKPPSPADEMWLLWMCLQQNWPDGGLLFIGVPEKWPSRRDNIWTHFRDFIEQHRVRKHPRLSQVKAWTRDLLHTHKTSQMIKNLAHLCRISERKKIQARDRARIEREGKDVKIAGT